MAIDQLLLLVATFLVQSSYAFYVPITQQPIQTWLRSSSLEDTDPSIICIGDALFDCIANERGMPVSEMITKGEASWTAYPGGAPANVATACCKLGTRTAFVGCVGQDEDGDALERLLRDTGVDTTLLQRSSDAPTRRVLVTRSLEGDRAFGGFADDRGAEDFADCLLNASVMTANEKYESIMDGAKWIACSTLSLAFEKSADAIRTLVKRGQEGGARLCVDINWRPVFWSADEAKARETILEFAKKANIVKLTDEEAEWLFGITDSIENPSKVHAEFPNAQGVLVTAGEKGASYSLWGASEVVDAFEIDVQDTTGAGDAFTAGMLHGFISVEDIDDLGEYIQEEVYNIMDPLVRFAAIAGALTCTKEGAIAAQPTMSEIEDFIFS